MTKAEAIANHRKMWRWIADETERRKCVVDKSAYFDAMGITGNDRPLAQCYCCEYTNNHNDGICELCPIEWPMGRYCGSGGLYNQWLHAYDSRDWHKAAALARQIAELPEKDDKNAIRSD